MGKYTKPAKDKNWDEKLKANGMMSESHLAYIRCTEDSVDECIREHGPSACFGMSECKSELVSSLEDFYYIPVSLIIETKIENHSIFNPILGEAMDIIKKNGD